MRANKIRHLQITVVLLSIFLFSCSHNKIIKTYELKQNTALPKIHKYDQVQLTFANGENRHVEKLIVSPDSSTYFDIEKKEDVKIATQEISSMYYHDWVRGGLRLGGLGLLIGIPSGILYGEYENSQSPNDEWFNFEIHPSIYGLTVGICGGLAGFLKGAIIGVDTTYEFQHGQKTEIPQKLNYINEKYISKE